MNNNSIKFWLALARAPETASARFRDLLAHFGDLEALFSSHVKELKALKLPEELVSYIQKPNWHGVDNDLAWGQQSHHHIITWADERYPLLLKEIKAPPPLLFVAGDPHLLMQPQIALVGSRNPTVTGRETAHRFAGTLSKAGLTITSGMARGIDGASHEGALDAGGKTIAVMGTGPDIIYPRHHRQLAEQIQVHGAMVSEFSTGLGAHAKNFPRRNRIVSGMSLGTLVVEATLRSGSLITARLANEQGREVFAIPGSIYNGLSKGCHYLLRDGAKLVETANDIIEELGALAALTATLQANENNESNAKKLDADTRILLECVGFEPTTLDLVVKRSGLQTSEVSSKLLILELAGHINRLPGGYMRVTL